MKNCLILIAVLCTALWVNAQDSDYAREVIKTLASPTMHGRGYVKKGDRKAALFLVRELKKAGAEPFHNAYFQHFNISVNTFPTAMHVRLGERILQAGTDYLIDPSSPGIKGSWKVVSLPRDLQHISRLASPTHAPLCFLALDTLGADDSLAARSKEVFEKYASRFAGRIITVRNLPVWRPSGELADAPALFVRHSEKEPLDTMLKINIVNRYRAAYETRNVLASIPGETDTMLIFTAHYDHLGRMGKATYFPGAHDNASGTAMLLNLIRYYADTEKRPKYTLGFFFFGAEEAGLLGSRFFVDTRTTDLSKIRFLINLDLIGSGDEGITVVNAKEFPAEFSTLDQLNKEYGFLPAIKSRGAAANSDHYFFYANGVKCFYIYTLGAYKEYHTPTDKAEGLPLSGYEGLFRLLTGFVSTF